MKPKISVIVPIYKVEKYLSRCIDSILNQTLQEIEIILIEDGSPDACRLICDEYAKKDCRIKVIHKNNEGVSAARNDGLNEAIGEFIAFVDADDYISRTMLEDMYFQAIYANADIAVCNYLITDDKIVNFYCENSNIREESILLDVTGAFKLFMDFSKPIQVAVWNKIYKNSLLHNIYFDTNKKMSEDLEFLMKALIKSQRIVYLPVPLYAYHCQREGAATHHDGKDLKWYLLQNDYITEIMEFVAIKANEEIRRLAAGYKCVNGDLSIANAMVRSNHFERSIVKLIKKELIENFGIVMKSKLNFIKKIQIFIFIISPRLYSFFMRNKLN